MFSITVPASSRALLSLAEIKAAVGETGSTNDAALTALGAQLSDAIVLACGVPSDGVTPPTLLRETIVETVRHVSHFSAWGFPNNGQRHGDMIDDRLDGLLLSRRFVSSVDSVIVNGDTLDPSAYEIDRSPAILRSISSSSGGYSQWPSGVSVVTYQAGFVTPPEPLKLAATLLIREAWAIMKADPLVRGETFEGLGAVQYGLGSLMSQNGGMPPGIADIIATYRHSI